MPPSLAGDSGSRNLIPKNSVSSSSLSATRGMVSVVDCWFGRKVALTGSDTKSIPLPTVQ